MPIRFRCAFCNQLMAIAHRKMGVVVRCPKCSGQVVVPASSETSPPGSSSKKTTPLPRGGLFDGGDFGKIFEQTPSPAPADANVPEAIDVEPIMAIRGIFLTPWRIFILSVSIVALVGLGFLAGWLFGSR